MRRAIRRTGWTGAFAVALALLWGLYLQQRGVLRAGDTIALVGGGRILWDCIREGVTPCVGVSQFPIFQHIPVMPFAALRRPDWEPYSFLGYVSVTSIAGLTLLAAALGKAIAGRFGLAFGVALVLSGPFLYYDASTWGEPLAAFLTVLPIALLFFGSGWGWVFTAAVLASITKDTAPVTLVLLSLATVGALARSRDPRGLRTATIAVVVGAAVGFALSIAFNVARYDTWRNVVYLEQVPRPPGLGFVASAAGALWLSPSGGVFVYWPLMLITLPLVVVAIAGVVRRGPVVPRLARACVLAALAFNWLVLANFAAPFGWIAWGPRLMLAWLPAVVIVLCILERPTVLRWADVCAASRVRIIVIAALAGASVIVNVAARLTEGWLAFFAEKPATDPFCPGIIYMSDPRMYFHCLGSMLWDSRGPLAGAFDGLGASGAIVAVGLALAVAGFVITGRRPPMPRGGHRRADVGVNTNSRAPS